MFGYGNCIEEYNPEILFVFKASVNGAECIPNLKYHCHDFLELSIVIEGEVDYIIEGQEYNLKRGQLVLANPGTYHKQIVDEKSKYSELYLAINNFVLSEIRENYIDNKGGGPVVTLKKYEDEFLNCCEEIINEENNKRLGYPLVLKSLIMRLLIILCREIEDDEAILENEHNCSFKSSEKQNMVKSIIKYMENYYMNEISLDKIAKNMYVSPVYISKIFKDETGDSPINHLIKIRLSKAEYLLRNTDMSIRAVAKNVGYSDAYHFSKLFKKYYGISPSQAKKT